MIPHPDTLDEVGNFVLAELENLPLADLDRLIQRVSEAEETARHYKQFLQGVLHRRFGERAHQLRQDAGKSTGTVRFDVDGHTVIADLPRKWSTTNASSKKRSRPCASGAKTPRTT